jgi:hypothetical protein
MSVEVFDLEPKSPPERDWRAVAAELANSLQETMLRNPSLTAPVWGRAHAALQRYERAAAA